MRKAKEKNGFINKDAENGDSERINYELRPKPVKVEEVTLSPRKMKIIEAK